MIQDFISNNTTLLETVCSQSSIPSLTKLPSLTNSLTHLSSTTVDFLVFVSLQVMCLPYMGVEYIALHLFLPFCSARNDLSVQSIQCVREAVVQPLIQSSFLHSIKDLHDLLSYIITHPTIPHLHTHTHTYTHTHTHTQTHIHPHMHTHTCIHTVHTHHTHNTT